MIIAHGPWIWDRRQPFLSRVLVVTDSGGLLQLRQERKRGILNPQTGEEVVTIETVYYNVNGNIFNSFAEMLLEDAGWFQPQIVSPTYAAEWVASRPKTINEFCERVKDDTYFDEWLDEQVFLFFDQPGDDWDDTNLKIQNATMGFGRYDKIEFLINEADKEMWWLWDEWMETHQP